MPSKSFSLEAQGSFVQGHFFFKYNMTHIWRFSWFVRRGSPFSSPCQAALGIRVEIVTLLVSISASSTELYRIQTSQNFIQGFWSKLNLYHSLVKRQSSSLSLNSSPCWQSLSKPTAGGNQRFWRQINGRALGTALKQSFRKRWCRSCSNECQRSLKAF